MIIRKNIIPRAFTDTLCLIFLLCIIPVIYCFELFIVIPTFYPMWSFWYNFNFILGNFITLNLVTNLVALLIVDTSVKGRIMPVELKPDWRFCSVCESVVPPRSWHCDVCRTCILKRDHHCVFVGYCIGHNNYRYFMMFVSYIFLVTFYTFYFNTCFIYNNVDFSDKMTILKMVFPIAMLFWNNSSAQIYIILYLIVLFGMLITGVLLWYHTSLILNGQVSHEKSFNIDKYCYSTKRNIELVLGVKWYLTWINPFIVSDLPHDGIYWEPTETGKNK